MKTTAEKTGFLGSGEVLVARFQVWHAEPAARILQVRGDVQPLKHLDSRPGYRVYRAVWGFPVKVMENFGFRIPDVPLSEKWGIETTRQFLITRSKKSVLEF
jgi:hypothetical protein